MKDIKFRAFVDGEMRQIELVILECEGNKIKKGFISVAWQAGPNTQTFKDIPAEDLRHYVGHNGMNNTEIYSGDIVRHVNYKTLPWVGIQEVKQDEWGRWLPFGPHNYKPTKDTFQLTILVSREFEVIGNIHESPELLEEI